MSVVGRVESLWRYPVKSMRGEELREAFIGFSGVFGDRLYAFRNLGGPKGMPFLTGTKIGRMLLYHPRFRHAERAAKPVNVAEAEKIAPGLNPLYPGPADLVVDVETPSGEVLAIDDPGLIRLLCNEVDGAISLELLRSDRAMTDCRPISLISNATMRQLGEEIGTGLDKLRFRANVYVDLDSGAGFREDAFVGGKLQIGRKAVVAVLERDLRCKMISIDPDTAEANPQILRHVVKVYENYAGVYGAVLVEGIVHPGDEIVELT